MESELKLKEIWLCKKVPTGTRSGEPQTYFLPADTLNWLGLEAAGALMESPPHDHIFPAESPGGEGTGTSGPRVLMISLLWGRIPSWGSAGSQWHLHHKVPSTQSALRWWPLWPLAGGSSCAAIPLFGMAELWAQGLSHLVRHCPPPLNSKTL